MKKDSISKQFTQQKEIQSTERETEVSQGSNIDNLLSINLENNEAGKPNVDADTDIIVNQENKIYINPSFYQRNNLTSNSFISFIPLETTFLSNAKEEISKLKNSKKKRRRL